MKKWQEERNYRRIYNEAGEAIANTLDIYTHAFDKNKKAASAGLRGMLEI